MEGAPGDDTVRLTRGGAARTASPDGAGPAAPRGLAAGPFRAARGALLAAAALAGLVLAGTAALLLWPGAAPEREGAPVTVAPQGAPTIVAPQGAPATVPPQGAPTIVPPQGAPTIVPPQGAPIPVPPQGAPATVPPPPVAATPASPMSDAPPPRQALPAPGAPPSEAAQGIGPPPPQAATGPAAPASPSAASPPLPAPAATSAAPVLASEAELRALAPEAPRMFRLRENPRVFVLLFPSLDMQGAALNRLAALVEKSGLPRDRIMGEAELAAEIERRGDTAATWYLGHDYAGADIARFLALAARDGVALNPEEAWVAARFDEARALVPPGSEIALISTANPDRRMDATMRASILRHEIGHGHFFTMPALRAHVLKVWRERFRERDRQAMRHFLGREGYDTTNELLMANEAMAYLLFTPDQRFFSARLSGIPEAELGRMRDAMREGAPLP